MKIIRLLMMLTRLESIVFQRVVADSFALLLFIFFFFFFTFSMDVLRVLSMNGKLKGNSNRLSLANREV